MFSCLERYCGAARVPTARVRSSYAPAACVLAAVCLTGCGPQPPPAPPPGPAMEIDSAMQMRDWERSAAWYPNGDTVSGVNRFPIRSQGGTAATPDYANAAIDLGASMAQTVALPFTYLFVPPFARATYTGENIPPTHTGMPIKAPTPPPSDYGVVPPTHEEQLRQLESPEPLPKPAPTRDQRRDPSRGPLGPGDSDFMSSPPRPEEPD